MATRHSRYSPVGDYTPFHINAAGVNVPVGACVSTTGSPITAGSNVVVTPASMNNIVPGLRLNIANGTGNAEDVTVLSVTPTTFTANFVYSHSGAYTIISLRGTFLGKVVVNQLGSNTLLTLYNGHPQNSHGSSIIAVVNPATVIYPVYDCAVDNGLYYTLAVTGSAPDLTLMYVDMPA